MTGAAIDVVCFRNGIPVRRQRLKKLNFDKSEQDGWDQDSDMFDVVVLQPGEKRPD